MMPRTCINIQAYKINTNIVFINYKYNWRFLFEMVYEILSNQIPEYIKSLVFEIECKKYNFRALYIK